MMSFGEQIDHALGHYISHTMIAAAIGNWVSDLFGLGTSERVESALGRVYPAPELTDAQYRSKKFHNYKYAGRFWGITFGCLIGAIAGLPFLHDVYYSEVLEFFSTGCLKFYRGKTN